MGDGIAKHLARGLQGPLGQIIDTPSRDGLDHGDQFRGLDLCHRARADVREDIGFKAPNHLPGMLFATSRLPMRPPHPGH